MNEPVPHNPQSNAATESGQEPDYEFLIGDKLLIPGHQGNYVGEVVHRYPNFEAACEEYKGSFRTILQAPRDKPKPDQPFYHCQVANSTRQDLGVAQGHATLKWRRPEESAD